VSQILTLSIDGSWTPQDLIEVLRAVESMYYKLSLWDNEGLSGQQFRIAARAHIDTLDISNEYLLKRGREYIDRKLLIRRIIYGSPGSIDLLGVGKFLEVIANTIGKLVDYYDNKTVRHERNEQARIETEKRRTDLKIQRESLTSLQIKNAENALVVIHKYPKGKEVLLRYLVADQEFISERISSEKLISAGITASVD